MSDDPLAQHVNEDDIAALALGLLMGEARALAFAHIDACAQCSATLEQFSVGADGLLQLSPELDPPAGFEVRVLERMHLEGPPIRTLRRSRVVLGALAAALALVVGIGIGHLTAPSSPAAQSAQRAAGTGAALTATLIGDGKPRGTVVVFSGKYPWLLMTMRTVPNGTPVICKVESTSGKLITIGSYWLTSDSDSWSARLPLPVRDVRSVVITSPRGVEIASAPIVS